MVQTSFTERLQRIEAGQDRPMKDRILAGISDEQRKMERAPQEAAAAKVPRKGFKPFRFVVGFALMFAGMKVVSNMSAIDSWLDASDQLAPLAMPAMASIAISIVFLMLFFAFKLQRAAFRVMSEPGRLVFALGMVLGLSVGLGPSEFTDVVMAQLQAAAP